MSYSNKRNLMLLIAGLLLACGKFKIDKSDDEKSGAEVSKDGAESVEDVKLTLTAEYESKPVDVVLLRESRDVFINDNNNTVPFKTKLYQAVNQPVAYRELAVRLQNSGLDLQFGVLESGWQNRGEANTNSGNLLGNADDQEFILKPSEQFIEKAFERMRHTYGRVNTYPMTTLRNFLERVKVESPSKGMLRSDALLAILYVGISDEVDESYDWTTIRDLLNKEKGEGNWLMSAIASPASGCQYNLTNPEKTKRHTNDFYEQDSAKWDTYLRRNKVLSLQEHSGGLFESICAETYLEGIKRFAGEGTQSAFFGVELKKPADPETIEVKVNKSPVEGWRYLGNKQMLLLPTAIKNGTEFVVTYKTPRTGDDESVYGPSNPEESVGKIGKKGVSPAELAFVNDGVQQILQSNNCGGGCHNGTNYANFGTAYERGAIVVQRLLIPEGMAQHMPKDLPSLPAADIQKVQDWVDTF